jgi:thioredoxin reductase
MTKYLVEKHTTEVYEEYDIIVAGVAAAFAAARLETKTLLLEKQVVLGGLATTGHIAIYLSLCDGIGKQDHRRHRLGASA